MLLRLASSLLALPALLCACASNLDPALEARQIVVRLEPTGTPLDVRVDRFGSICWLLPAEVATSGEVRVAIDGGLEPSSVCSTTYGFEAPAMGRRRSEPLRPGACAVICFHDPGEFRFRVEGLTAPLEGVVKVGGPR
jgi:hypothetical protein